MFNKVTEFMDYIISDAVDSYEKHVSGLAKIFTRHKIHCVYLEEELYRRFLC